MKVRATTNFAGEICMATGEVRDVPESIAAPLLDCGYLEAMEPEQVEPEAEQDTAQTDEPEAPQEPEPKKTKRTKAKTED